MRRIKKERREERGKNKTNVPKWELLNNFKDGA